MPKRNANCSHCSKNFEYYLSMRRTAKYCSRNCQLTAVGKKNLRPNKFWESATYEQKIERIRNIFESHVIRKDGCWDWNGSLSGTYGHMRFNNKNIGIHRASWMIHRGEIPEGYSICHTCDNKSCSNPDHLFLGTPKDNIQDMFNKGRENKPQGEKIGTSKLTNENVFRIKELINMGVSCTRIAKDFGVHCMTVYDIKHNKTWKHI